MNHLKRNWLVNWLEKINPITLCFVMFGLHRAILKWNKWTILHCVKSYLISINKTILNSPNPDVITFVKSFRKSNSSRASQRLYSLQHADDSFPKVPSSSSAELSNLLSITKNQFYPIIHWQKIGSRWFVPIIFPSVLPTLARTPWWKVLGAPCSSCKFLGPLMEVHESYLESMGGVRNS